jgi:hypothetical protein
MEGLARIANAKYKETGVKETFGEALETLIEECLIPIYDWRPW